MQLHPVRRVPALVPPATEQMKRPTPRVQNRNNSHTLLVYVVVMLPSTVVVGREGGGGVNGVKSHRTHCSENKALGSGRRGP